jgi:DNA polymerase III epsilon subunit-like protein
VKAVATATIPFADTVREPPAIRKSEIAFFDIESSYDVKGRRQETIEFGAIIVDKLTFQVKQKVNFMIRPASGTIDPNSFKIHRISIGDLRGKPSFAKIADKIYDVLNGRIWSGHNIDGSDIPVLRREFNLAKHAMPQNAGTIDTYKIIPKVLPKDRAGNYKMASLGRYYGHGEERHRALDDCVMTLQVLKSVATGHFLEKFCPEMFCAPVAEESSDGY